MKNKKLTMQDMKHQLFGTTGELCKALMMLALVCVVVLPQGLRAQESATGYYTLTNGTHTWLEGPEGSARETEVLLENDCYGAEIHLYDATNVNIQTRRGDYYLALDITTDPGHPAVKSVPTATGFTPYCVWKRTGVTGYYYQEWDNYRYYLIGTRNALSVEKVEVGASKAYYSKF